MIFSIVDQREKSGQQKIEEEAQKFLEVMDNNVFKWSLITVKMFKFYVTMTIIMMYYVGCYIANVIRHRETVLAMNICLIFVLLMLFYCGRTVIRAIIAKRRVQDTIELIRKNGIISNTEYISLEKNCSLALLDYSTEVQMAMYEYSYFLRNYNCYVLPFENVEKIDVYELDDKKRNISFKLDSGEEVTTRVRRVTYAYVKMPHIELSDTGGRAILPYDETSFENT